MATLRYTSRPSLRPSRALSTLLARKLRDQPEPIPAASTFIPAADILETAAGFELHLALPGVQKEAVRLEFLDGQLVVSGARPNPAATARQAAATTAATDADQSKSTARAPAAPRFHRFETGFGTFTRSFRLPDTVNVKAIAATYRDGVLCVKLPFDTLKVTKQPIKID